MKGFSTTQLFILLLIATALAFGLRSRELLQNFMGGDTPPVQVSEGEGGDVRVSNSTIRDLRKSFSTSERLAQIEPAADEGHEDAKSAESDDDAMAKEGEDHSGLGDPPSAGDGTQWRDFMDEDIQFSESRLKLLEDLSARRKTLDGKEKELTIREALLQAAERELDQKYEELELLKSEIEQLLGQQSEEEEKRIQSLVKIYEGMKAKDAARIFNTLDTDVLLSVLSRMSERKSAPIIASMDPNRARSVTILLAEQKSLPNLSAQ